MSEPFVTNDNNSEFNEHALQEQAPAVIDSKANRNWVPMIAGTVLLLGIGLITLQYLRPTGASATTNEAQPPVQKKTPQALARVNDQYVTYEEVAQECFTRIGEEVLDNFINRVVIQQEVKKRGIVITEADITQEVARIAQKFSLPVDSWYQMLQAERNLSPAQYQRDIIWPKIALQKLAGADVQINEQDMQKAFVRDYGPRVRCRMIMLDKITRANEVWEKVKNNPQDFDKFAREYSTEPNSRAIGGAFPPVARYSGNHKLEDVAFRMKTGEISGIIEAGVGQYVILKCEGLTEPVVTDMKEVQKELYENLVEERTQERVAKVFEDLRKNTRVDNFLTNQSSGGVTPAAGQQQPGTTTKLQPTSGSKAQ